VRGDGISLTIDASTSLAWIFDQTCPAPQAGQRVVDPTADIA
jgi:hypothetical protein